MEEKQETYYVGVRFPGADKAYYYSTRFLDLKLGDVVIVDSDGVIEAATVSTTVKSTSGRAVSMDTELKPIIRKATAEDLRTRARNETKSKILMEIAQKEAQAKKLPMDFIAAYLSFNGDVITLVYTSTEKRVDFRELLPILGARLKARVSLRQIASRDRAKMIGGLGICGLPLCCSTFLTTFESISISKMKNQMLAINIPKYSGPCEKLMCCLAYEDELYAQEKTKFPRIGQEVKYNGEAYTVNSFNILSQTVRLANADHSDFQTFPLEDILAMQNGTYVPHKEEVKPEKEYTLPDYNIKPSAEEKPERDERQKQGKNDKKSQDSQRKSGKDARNEGRGNRSDKAGSKQEGQQQKGRDNRHKGNRGSQQEQRQQKGNQQDQQGRQNQQSQQGKPSRGNPSRPREERRQKGNRPANPGQNGDASNRVEPKRNEESAQKRNNNHHRRYHHNNRSKKEGGGGEQAAGEGGFASGGGEGSGQAGAGGAPLCHGGGRFGARISVRRCKAA